MTRIKQIWRMLWFKLCNLWRWIRRKPKIHYYVGTLTAADISADTITSTAINLFPDPDKKHPVMPSADVRWEPYGPVPTYTDDELLKFVDQHLSPAAREAAAKGRKK